MKCLECQKEFKSEKGLHLHFRSHKITPTQYYFKHFGRKSLATGQPIEFKGLHNYHRSFFNSRQEMRKWFREAKSDNVLAKAVANQMCYDYMSEKNIKLIPCEFETTTANCPSSSVLKKFDVDLYPFLFACEKAPKINLAPSYFIDTREQTPFDMPNAVVTKLDIGDYAAAGEFFENVFCDRKSGGDFVSTFTSGFERFKKEMERSVQSDAFLYVIVESDLKDLYKNSVIFKRQNLLELALHNCRSLLRDYPRQIQFILAGNVENAKRATQYVLSAGKKGTKYDYQYLINNELEPWN